MEYTGEYKEFIESLDIREESEDITNPFTGRTVKLPPLGVALYDVIKGAEILEDYNTMRMGLDIFIQEYPEEYYVLLD